MNYVKKRYKYKGIVFYLASILDQGDVSVSVSHNLIVSSEEKYSFVVVALVGVLPTDGVLASVGEALSSFRRQQSQEVPLRNAHVVIKL